MPRWRFPCPRFSLLTLLADGSSFVAGCDDEKLRRWSRRRPENWWGIAWLPEFWIAYFSGGALLVIAARNLRRRFSKLDVPASPV